MSSNQVFVHEPLLIHAANDSGHLIQRVEAPNIVPSGELVHVTVQVLLADLVVRALVPALQH